LNKHVFLPGEIQIGKSTALRHFLERSAADADGFLTFFDARHGDERTLFLGALDCGRVVEKRAIARMTTRGAQVFTDVFEGFGADVLARAGRRGLIVMDELGNLEEGAERFRREVFALLDGDKPVVGVVKKRASPFLDAVRAHPNIILLTVTKENREEIPDALERLALTR
jgi:nucleoside-triphosphatase